VENTPCLLEEADSPTPPASGEALVAEAGETPQTDTEKPDPPPARTSEDPSDTQSPSRPASDDTQSAPVAPAPSQKPERSGGRDGEEESTHVAGPEQGDAARDPPTPPTMQDTPPAIDMPDTLAPCETRRDVPCRLTVAKTGLWTLREVAEFYYGTPQAWCRIHRVNRNVFDGRGAGDGNSAACISLDDRLRLPPRPASGRYSRAGCPEANPATRCD
jgi:hypothetical protein